MTVQIYPAASHPAPEQPIEFAMPPDKSMLHRILFLGSLTQSHIRIPIHSIESISHDAVATVLALESLGVPVEITDDAIDLQGVGRHGLRSPSHTINCANSGTTARLLMGLLAGQPFECTVSGDDSLSKRPMKRVADLLARMGAHISSSATGTLPLTVHGNALRGTNIILPVASAQIKSALLIAGLYAQGETGVREPYPSRDHTERLLEALGFGIEFGNRLTIHPETQPELPDELEFVVPGDPSSAAFLIAAAVLLRRRIRITNLSLNPTRTRFFDVLTLMGVELEATEITELWNEPRGSMTVFGDRTDELMPFEIDESDVPLLIDELPVLMVLALFAHGESSIRGARELRLKESDRIALAVKQFRAFGADIQELDDGMIVSGIPVRRLVPAVIDHGGDHRLTMAFSIAALFCETPTRVPNAEIASVSYPHFYEDLHRFCGDCVEISAL